MGDRDDKVVGYVSEEPVYEKDFLISYERAKYTGAEDPYDAAVGKYETADPGERICGRKWNLSFRRGNSGVYERTA